ncbi:MAG: hypothetical protein ACYCWE_00680 [Eubacteriales bacterium]
MKRTISLILIMVFIFPLLNACSQTSDKPSDTTSEILPESVFTVVSGGSSEYIIVRGDTCEQWETDAAINFRKTVETLTATALTITTDWEKPDSGTIRPAKEILIGLTNREGSADDVTAGKAEYTIDRDVFGYSGFVIKTEGEKIIIAAETETGMKAALQYFFLQYAGYDISGGNEVEQKSDLILSLPGEYTGLTPEDSSLFEISDKTDLVSICYSTWFDPVINTNGIADPPNISEVLAGERDWGGLHAFHYWAKPALGYYRSTDKSVIRTHMTQLAEAGVDFIIVDNTNAGLGWKESDYWYNMVEAPCRALLDTIVGMRAEGLATPYVVMWCNTANGWDVVDELYSVFVQDEKYRSCWVWWDGQPFFITTAEMKIKNDKITSRKMWGLVNNTAPFEWSFLQKENTPNLDNKGNAEQMCVCVAMQETYMSLPTATGRNHGITFYSQWKNAFEARPKVISITWWNEWVAQRFEENGKSLFVDNYNQEYSRDIEPMEGGHGDTYYLWMKQYIAAYKAHEECPRLVEEGF